MAKFTITSKKFGTHAVLVDEEDLYLLENYLWHLWGTERHYGIYVTSHKDVLGYKRLHRLIMQAPKGYVVDHINGNPLDNRKCNLRITTQANNNKNSSRRRESTSIYKGVHLNKKTGKYMAQIQIDEKRTSLGSFKLEVDAALAYNKAALTYYGEYAKLNIIGESDEK